ncbi:MAG TPA: DUF6691 family protein [Myxococcota bacterium]|nr:DUF6691 family protein [Myxococcota bacterium]
MRTVVAGLCGIAFGVGLALAGMTNPAKVLAFLDVFGRWDPTLAFVMAGALAVSAAGYRLAWRRPRAWLGDAFGIPTRRDLDGSLLAGAALFGVGWGLVGLCPGPALANLFRVSAEIGIFVAAMLAGVIGYRAFTWMRAQSAPRQLEGAAR